MGLLSWLSRGSAGTPVAAAEAAFDPVAEDHAVLVHLALRGEYGSAADREAVFALEDRLEAAIEAMDAGELDGNEFGGGEVVLYLYGPSKDRLWDAVEADVRAVATPGSFVLLRPGGPDVVPERIDL
jgi:hypothetical protein